MALTHGLSAQQRDARLMAIAKGQSGEGTVPSPTMVLQVREAIAWAEEGGIAVHRNFDHYHGTRSARGFVMTRPFLHVIGLRPVLQEWGRLHGLRPEWIQPEKRRKVAHYDVFGPPAEALIQRLRPALDSD